MNINGLDPAAVLAVLYNRATPFGMGFTEYDPKPMTIEEARSHLARETYFEYLKGRAMSITIEGEEISTGGYNMDNGDNAAEDAVAELRATGKVTTQWTEAEHRRRTLDAAREAGGQLSRQVRSMYVSLDELTGHDHDGDIVEVFSMGLADPAAVAPKIAEVLARGDDPA